MCNCANLYGTVPANIKWEVTRGDTAELRIDFLESDESTAWDTGDWTYTSSAYDPSSDSVDELEVEDHEGYVILRAPADLTVLWGTGYGKTLAQIPFDLKVTISTNPEKIWTPVSGTIVVNPDVSSGL
jgi:hypothetical protein